MLSLTNRTPKLSYTETSQLNMAMKKIGKQADKL